MDWRVALTQYDASGAVLQSCTCFVSAAPSSPVFIRELFPQLRAVWLKAAALIEVAVGADDPVLRIKRDDLERSLH
jgi:hypothetical protein